MLDILEGFLRAAEHTYMRMDGSTNVKSRQAIVENFNEVSLMSFSYYNRLTWGKVRKKYDRK